MEALTHLNLIQNPSLKFAAAHLDNTASNKILANLGFTRLETFELDGAIHNWYGLKKEHWM